MTGFLGKFFGGKKKEEVAEIESFVEEMIETLIDKTGMNLSFSMEMNKENEELLVDFQGEDEELLQAREGQLLDSLQLFLRRVVQHQMPDERINVTLDAGGFRDRTNDQLIELAEKLKNIALSKGKSVYFRALPPKDRKVVHQYLAEDGRVKSRSVGEGHFKKIKIFPVKGSDQPPLEG